MNLYDQIKAEHDRLHTLSKGMTPEQLFSPQMEAEMQGLNLLNAHLGRKFSPVLLQYEEGLISPFEMLNKLMVEAML